MRAGERKRLLPIAAFLSVVCSPASAFFDNDKVLKRYGIAGDYSVEFSRNGICVARRVIKIRDLAGGRKTGGEFAYGVAEYAGLYVTLVSFLDPNWDYRPGQTARGSIDIDGVRVYTTFYVEERTVVSGTLPESMLRNVALSRELTLTAAGRSYRFRPQDSSEAYPLLLKCIRESLKAGDRPARVWGGVEPALP